MKPQIFDEHEVADSMKNAATRLGVPLEIFSSWRDGFATPWWPNSTQIRLLQKAAL
jgi:hypothetical protein